MFIAALFRITLQDAIASFLGILELIKIRKLLLDEEYADGMTSLGKDTRFILNKDASSILKNDLGIEGKMEQSDF